jgi:hypothetical protein
MALLLVYHGLTTNAPGLDVVGGPVSAIGSGAEQLLCAWRAIGLQAPQINVAG